MEKKSVVSREEGEGNMAWCGHKGSTVKACRNGTALCLHCDHTGNHILIDRATQNCTQTQKLVKAE